MWKEILCTLFASLLGTPGGILMFIPIYHPLHDVYKLHSEVTFFILFAIFLLIIWSGDRKAQRNNNDIKPKTFKSTFLLILHLIVHYTSFLIMPIFFKPEDEIAVGLKEPIGPCDKIVPVQTVFGVVSWSLINLKTFIVAKIYFQLKKRQFLCVTDYDEKYFDFHCIPKEQIPPHGSHWYTACGVPLQNQVEMIAIVSLICVIACCVFWNLHFNSFGDEAIATKLKATKVSTQKKKKWNKEQPSSENNWTCLTIQLFSYVIIYICFKVNSFVTSKICLCKHISAIL